MQELSSLVSAVVGDTAVGVTDGERQAAAGRAEIQESLDAAPEELVSEADVDRALRRVAPPLEAPPTGLLYEALPPMSVERYLESWTPGDSAVRRGEVYLHPRFVEDADATPYEAVESAFDVTVDSQDLAVRGGVPFLTDTATARIRSAVATSLGRDRQAALSALAESGVPRPVVEDLDVDVKVAYGEGLRVRPVDPAGDDLVPEAVGSVGAKIHFNTVEVS